uniref:PGG domain-containing protein n=1 Tax=Davidia involucrata TaxID=16924 RepID=A0A5B7C6I3_DAVIN
MVSNSKVMQEVENFVVPRYRKEKNIEGKTPLMIFNEEHEKLVTSEGQWMRGMANSCIVAASLVAIVVFAAAIAVPGGNSHDGLPIFFKEMAFKIFAILDALALFSSLSSVLSFLSVLTSRYAAIDFLYDLPKRLIIGLVNLFISVTCMVIAFSAALYLVFGQGKAWVLITVATFACLPVTLFVLLQFPLIRNMIKSTYGPSIFRKPSERILLD